MDRFREEGFRTTFRQALEYVYNRYLRTYVPTTRPMLLNGVQVGKRVPATDFWLPFDTIGVDEEYKGPNVRGIRESVNPGDNVAIIGGGLGVTVVVACEEAGSKGIVDVYEASKKRTNQIKETKQMNSSSFNIHHASVGPIQFTPAELGNPQELDPGDLPAYDVMELDCEGAETDIIPALDPQPQVIIVETHGFRGSPSAVTESQLRGNGYVIEWKRPVDNGPAYAQEQDAYVIKARKSEQNSE